MFRQQHPIQRRARVDRQHRRRSKRNKRHLHRWLDLINSQDRWHGQLRSMQQSPSSNVWHVFETSTRSRTNPTRNNGSQKQTWIRSPIRRNENDSWLAHQLQKVWSSSQMTNSQPGRKLSKWYSRKEKTTAKTLETNIGRLVHLSMAIPPIHHFMSRLRDPHSTAKQRLSVKINGEQFKDLKLMLKFLKMANKGISLNSIPFRGPTHAY